MTERRPRKRVIVIGMDGLSWSVIDALLADGRLPSFRQALSSGAAAILRSTTPPLTPAAWSTLFSGLPPSEHRVFDFTAREVGSYVFRLCSSTDRRARMVWSVAGAKGRKVVVINVPMTYPPTAVNGLMVSGMDAPRLRGAVEPERATARILATAPDYAVDVMSHWFDDREVFHARLRSMHHARHRVALDLLDSSAADLFICVYVLADRVQHVEWSEPPSPAVCSAYEALDRVLGDYLDRIGEGDTLMVVSDHGFQSLRSEVCLNRLLVDGGLLRFKRGRCKDLVSRHDRRRTLIRSGIGQDTPTSWHLPPRAVWFNDVDWGRTRCAAFGLMGNVMVNQRGRDPNGIVAPGKDTAAVLRDVGQLVTDAVGKTISNIGVTVHPVVWDQRGPSTVSPPDAVVEVDGYRVGTWGGREFFCPSVLQDNFEGHTGTHSPEGVFIGVGRGMPMRAEREVNDAIDLTPTMMDLLELDPETRLPGRSLKEI